VDKKCDCGGDPVDPRGIPEIPRIRPVLGDPAVPANHAKLRAKDGLLHWHRCHGGGEGPRRRAVATAMNSTRHWYPRILNKHSNNQHNLVHDSKQPIKLETANAHRNVARRRARERRALGSGISSNRAQRGRRITRCGKSAFRAPAGQTGDTGGRHRVAGGSVSSGCAFSSNLSTARERVSYEKSGQVTWLGPEREVALGGEVP
jgi:hypothetical protein